MEIPGTVLCVLVAFALMWSVSQAYPPYGEVEIEDGKCKYEDQLIPNRESLNIEDPCVTMECDVQSRSFAVLGCGLIGNPYNCELVKGSGPYPNCCYRTNCSGVATPYPGTLFRLE